MTDIVITLVFSLVMLIFMVFPAMKIVEWIKPKTDFSKKVYTILQLLVTVILSLFIGLFLKFA